MLICSDENKRHWVIGHESDIDEDVRSHERLALRLRNGLQRAYNNNKKVKQNTDVQYHWQIIFLYISTASKVSLYNKIKQEYGAL